MKKSNILSSGMLALALSLWILNAVPGFAADKPAEDKDQGKTEEQAEKTKIPKALSAVWTAVTDHQKELHGVLAANKLDDVHHHAFAVRDLVAAMPAKSNSLPAEKKTELTKSSSRIASLAKLLDEAGDGGDSAQVATLVTKLDGELKAIESLYPAKDLKPAQANADASKQIYTCTMHPEVTSDKPGKCPKCGMNLVLKESTKGSK